MRNAVGGVTVHVQGDEIRVVKEQLREFVEWEEQYFQRKEELLAELHALTHSLSNDGT
jgi:hypothetical protein